MTIHERGARWLLALLKPNCVGIAKRNLVRQGFRTFLPMESGTRRVQGRLVDGLRPLFPGYIFVAHDPDRLHWRAIHSTNGISRLVCFGTEPAEVPLDLIGELMRRCDAAGTLLPPKIVKPGDPVRLAAGPFTAFVATIEAIAPERRVWVLLEIMGNTARVAVPVDHLRLA